MLNIIKNLLSQKQPEQEVQQVSNSESVVETVSESVKEKKKRVKKPTESKPIVKKTAKEIATEKGEPYVSIVNVDLDPNNIGNGAFELDWNEFFVAKLIRAGYKGNADSQIVDQWFQDVCRNVVLETFEQYEANNPRPVSGVQKKDIGSGRTEIS
jgi:hypothetical protein